MRMQNIFWKCPVCGFETSDANGKNEHLASMTDDPRHQIEEDEILDDEEKE